MTEEQYLKSCDYVRVLKTVRRMTKAGSTTVGRRKLRLLACGWCRLAFDGVPVDTAYQRIFDSAEAFADGRIDKAALLDARDVKLPSYAERERRLPLTRSAENAYFQSAAVSPVVAVKRVGFACLSARSLLEKRREWQGHLCHLARDIFGNPYRPAVFAPAWRTSAAVGVATAIYEDRAFDRLPILADALQDAGCEDTSVLEHCRGGGRHDRGCWVVDTVLRKG